MKNDNFKRARSASQKEERRKAIKDATMHQFENGNWHDISLGTIAQDVGCTRANMYVYYKTKEEIFLDILSDKFTFYFNSLGSALPRGCDFSLETIADIWAGIASACESYFRYSDALVSIIETNVSIEKLAQFKSQYYSHVDSIRDQLADVIDMDKTEVDKLILWIYYHGVGRAVGCHTNPRIKEALELIGKEPLKTDFRSDLKGFIKFCLEKFSNKKA